ncbi:S24 family peptidase [Prevotella koreensis]
MKKTKKERLHEIMKVLGLSDYRVYSDVPDITKNMMVKLRNGETKDASSKLLESFCKHYKNVNPLYLLIGEGSMLLEGDINQSGGDNSNNSGTITTNNYAGCGMADVKTEHNISKLRKRVSALEGMPIKNYEMGNPYYNVDFIGGFDIIMNDQTSNPDYLIDFKKYDNADFWCNITGHSMEPLISNGDIIAMKQMQEWRDFILYGEVYGIVTEDMRTVKVVTKSERGDDFIRLVPVNKSEEYQPQDIPLKIITHVFKILGCMKKL